MANYSTLESVLLGLELFIVWMTIGCWLFSDILLVSGETVKPITQSTTKNIYDNVVELSIPTPVYPKTNPKVGREIITTRKKVEPLLTVADKSTVIPTAQEINKMKRNELRELCTHNGIKWSRTVAVPGKSRKRDLKVTEMRQQLIEALQPQKPVAPIRVSKVS